MQNKYEVIGIVGEGAYGIVYKCRNKENGEFVAIKKFKETEDDVVRKSMLRELKVLKFLKHENIVEFKEAFKKKTNLYLVFEYVEKNLLELLQEHPKGLDTGLIKKVIFQLCLSIRYIHDMNLVHRDIKPENLLVDSNNKLKLCDFGFARQLKQGNKEALTDYVATRWYRAPEILLETGNYGPEVDNWAIGCIMGELVDGDPLFPGDNEIDQLCVIQKVLGPLPQSHVEILSKNPRLAKAVLTNLVKHETLEKRYMGKFNKVAINFLKGLLQMDPKLRLKGDAIFQHPYFEGMEIPNFNKNKELLKKIEEKADPVIEEKHEKIENKKNIPHNQDIKTDESSNLKSNLDVNIVNKSLAAPIINNTTNISIINYNYENKEKESKNKKFLKTTNNFHNNLKQEKVKVPGVENFNTNSKNMLPITNYQNNFKTFYNGNRYNYDIDMKTIQKNMANNPIPSNNETRVNKFEDLKIEAVQASEKKKAKSFNNIKNNTKSHFFNNQNLQSKFKVGDTGGDTYTDRSEPKVTPLKSKHSLDNKYGISNVIMEETYSKQPAKNESIGKYLIPKNSGNNVSYNNYKPLHNNNFSNNNNNNNNANNNFQLPNITSKNFFYKK